jgi:hypothetical protein
LSRKQRLLLNSVSYLMCHGRWQQSACES